MSKKVQPANDAGNNASDECDERDASPFSEKGRTRYLRMTAGFRAARLASSRADVPLGVLEVHYEQLPKAAQGPCVLSAFSQVEEALDALAWQAELLVSELESNPELHDEVARRIHTAAQSLGVVRPPSLSATEQPATSLGLQLFGIREQPEPGLVLLLFSAATEAVRRVVASREYNKQDAVQRVAHAVATIRALDEHSVCGLKRASISRARRFGGWFKEALGDLMDQTATKSLLAKANAMSEGFPGNGWPRSNTIYKLMRERKGTAATPLESVRFERLVDDIVEHARLPDLLHMWERDTPISEVLSYIDRARR